MAVLPDADAVGQIEDQPIRRMGIGSWQPSTISSAADAEGAGLERLGSTLGDIGAKEQQRQDALQIAQAKGDAYAQTYSAMSQAEQSTDPNVIAQAKASIPGIFSTAASKITSPYAQQMFNAEHEPFQAQVLDRITQRGRTIDNQNAVGNYSQNASTIIQNAAQLPDDAAAAQAMEGIQAPLKALEVAGAITPEMRVNLGKQATEQWATARSDYLLAKANATADPADRAAYLHFSGIDPKSYFGPDGAPLPVGPDGRPVAPGQAAQPQTAADGSPLPPPPRPPEFGGAQVTLAATRGSAAPTGDQPGMISAGNIDLANRPVARNPDGSISTVRSISIDVDGKEVLIPTVVGGKVVSNQEAIKHYKETGENLGTFDTPANADAYAEKLHDAQAAFYAPKAGQPATVGSPSPAGGPWVASSDGKTLMATDKDGTVVKNVTPISAAPAKAAPFTPAAGPASYPAMGAGSPIHGPNASVTSSNPFIAHLMGLESGGQNIVSGTDRDSHGLTVAQGGNPNEISQGYFQIQNHPGGTWSIYAQKAGVDLSQYPTPRSAPYDVQWKVASLIPFNEYGPRTVAGLGGMMARGGITKDMTLGQIAARFGETGFLAGTAPESGGFSRSLPGATSLTPLSYLQPNAPQMPIGLPYQDVSLQAIGPPPGGDALPAAAPPQSKWPADARTVQTDPSGAAVYLMADGSTQPVPGSKPTGMPYLQLPPPAPGSVAAMLPAPKRAEMQLRAVNQMREWQRQDALANQKDNRADLANISAVQKQMEGGSQLLTAAGQQGYQSVINAYGNSPDLNTRIAVSNLAAVHDALALFAGQSPQNVSAAVANMRAQFDQMVAANPTDRTGAIARASAVLTSAENYSRELDADVKKDPLARAASESVITLKPLNPASPTLSQDIADRVQAAHTAAQFLGVPNVPYFRPDEKAILRGVAKQGGDAMVNMAKAIVQGAGQDAGPMFKAMGGDAPVWQTIGTLAMDPNADHTDVIRQLAQYRAADNDKQLSKELPRFNDGVVSKAGGDSSPVEQALAGFGVNAMARIKGASHELMGQRAFEAGTSPANKDSYDAQFFGKAYNDTLGATYDNDKNQYGGISEVGSRWHDSGVYNVLVPTNMRADKFESVVGNLTNDDLKAMPSMPHSSDGNQVIDAAQMRGGKFVALPEADGTFQGRYGVELPNKQGVMARVEDGSGRPWFFDMNRLQDRYPNAFLPKTPGAPAPRYNKIPGVTIPDEGAEASAAGGAQG